MLIKYQLLINASKIPGELLRKNVTRNLSESSMSNGMLETLSNGKSNVFFTVKNIYENTAFA